jgi:hypothetical protein
MEIFMAKIHISPNRATDKTIRDIDRRREQERKKMFTHAKENAETLSVKLLQRLLDRELIETTSIKNIQETFENQLKKIGSLEEFELQMKLAPIRTLVPDPNVISLYMTQFIVEDLINHSDIQDIFGEDLDIYRAVDSVLKILRP